MSHRLKIAFIGQKGLPLGEDGGGVERHVEELGMRLALRGHEVLVYVRPRYLNEAERGYRGMRLVRTWSWHTRSFDTLTHAISSTLDAVRRGVDVIHYQGVGPSTVAWIAHLLGPRVKIVTTFHSIDRLHQKWGPIARAYLRWGEWTSLHMADATIAVSYGIQKYAREKYGREAIRIPNGAIIPEHPGSDLIGQWGLTPGKYILSVARLVQQKGIHHLIKAFDGFEKEFKLVVVGGGVAHSEYADLLDAQREGNSAVIFTGFQTQRALAQLYANAYIYVQPSEAEGLAISIIEAMAAGLCVLVSNIPENMESIDHSGITFVNANPDDLRAQLQKLINHPEIVLERGRRGRDWVKIAFSWDRIAEETEQVYRMALGEKVRPERSRPAPLAD